jgi:predicted metal-dependent peptidase
LIANGLHPGFFHNQLSTPAQRRKGLAIYLDVSGSVNEYLPKILGILQHLRREITSVFLFSNKVYETRFSTLLNGEIKTTGGTDFDCIAESILERQLDKAVIITDGYASMTEVNKVKLKRQGLITLTILFNRAQSCKEFAVSGDVVQLADICN